MTLSELKNLLYKIPGIIGDMPKQFIVSKEELALLESDMTKLYGNRLTFNGVPIYTKEEWHLECKYKESIAELKARLDSLEERLGVKSNE